MINITAPAIEVPRPAWATADNGWSSDGGDGWERVVSHRIGWPGQGGVEIERLQQIDPDGNITTGPFQIDIDLFCESLGGESGGNAATDAREFAEFLVQAAGIVEKSTRLTP